MKIGILGGGQLGRMLLQAAANYPVETFVLENDADCPAAHLCHHFTLGNIRDFDAVYNFGKGLDAITIEIENVNVEALEKLEAVVDAMIMRKMFIPELPAKVNFLASQVVGKVMKKLCTFVIFNTFITRGFTPVRTRQRPVFWCET